MADEESAPGVQLGDVLFVIISLANSQGIDLDAALEGVLNKYRLRDGDRWTRKGAAPID